MRYHLQRITTREWLSRDLELGEGVTTRALSAPGGITGKIVPELRTRRHSDGLLMLEKWASAIYAEDDGQIRGAGIITNVGYEGETATIDAPGFTVYPKGLVYGGQWPVPGDLGIQIDPLVVFRHLWDHVQSYPDGNLGLVVDQTTSPIRIGNNAEPYRLRWWDATDIGGEIDNLTAQTPFDFTEVHRWANAARSDVAHRCAIGYPRLGRRRNDLSFVEGVNISEPVPVESDGELMANEIIGLGKGEGSKMAYTRLAQRDGRLRRQAVVTDKTATQERIDAISRSTLRIRSGPIEDVTSIKVTDHPDARIAAITPGDDILIDIVDQPHIGRTRLWVRVLSIAEDDNGDTATIETRRSSTFTYSPTQEETSA